MKELLLLFALIIPQGDSLTPVYPMVEFNVVCNEQGNYRFQQVLCWDHYEGLHATHIRKWAMMDHTTVWFPRNDGTTVIIHKGEKFYARETKFSVTNYDPEERDRQYVQINER